MNFAEDKEEQIYINLAIVSDGIECATNTSVLYHKVVEEEHVADHKVYRGAQVEDHKVNEENCVSDYKIGEDEQTSNQRVEEEHDYTTLRQAASHTSDEENHVYTTLQHVSNGKKRTATREVDKNAICKGKWVLCTSTCLMIITLLTAVVTLTVLLLNKDNFSKASGSWGNWKAFSECSHSCSGGIQFRTRECQSATSTTENLWCDGNQTEIRPCNKHQCPVHGSWGEWTTFSKCSASCGVGIQSRRRHCENPRPDHDGSPCTGREEEKRMCNIAICPVRGVWGSWIAITECARFYGGGTQYRTRQCLNLNSTSGGQVCPGNATDIHHCPINGGWGSWSSFTSCSDSCGGGKRYRYRNCSNPNPAYGGIGCSGALSENQSCNAFPCPVHGGWSSWSAITSCSKSCGSGTRYYVRKCDRPRPAHGGDWCFGNDTIWFSCNTSSCPVNGGWGSWTYSSSCNKSCGGGTKTRYRNCSNPYPSNGGSVCYGSSLESQPCNTHRCPVNGGWSSWSAITSCSQTCGFGIQYYIRRCDNPRPVYGGVWCHGNDTNRMSCNTLSCPVNGGWGNWTVYSSCSRSCGGGTTYRHRNCSNPYPTKGGLLCHGDSSESQPCNTNRCPVHGGWSLWSAITSCSRSCGSGTRCNIRRCNNPRPDYGGNWCAGNDTNCVSCNTHSCQVPVSFAKSFTALVE